MLYFTKFELLFGSFNVIDVIADVLDHKAALNTAFDAVALFSVTKSTDADL